ncbi:MAG: hypothetical protein CMO98_05575 [Woeseia sp.]|nr:hypothetical protein [Woeseia sp.]
METDQTSYAENKLQDHTGIYSKDRQGQFIFLEFDAPIEGEVLSSIQSFETSLIMIGMGRWTNAIISITNSIETILRLDLETTSELQSLIGAYCQKHKISKSLEDAAHRTRKKRNEFVHTGIIPDDNTEAILVYFNDSISVFKFFLEKSRGINLYKNFGSAKLAENLLFAKNYIKSKRKTEGSVGFVMSVLVKTISNHLHYMVMPEYLSLTRATEETFNVIQSQRENLEDTFGVDGKMIHDLLPCPAECGGKLSALVEEETLSKLTSSVNAFALGACPTCGLFLNNRELVAEYIAKPMGDERITEILNSLSVST